MDRDGERKWIKGIQECNNCNNKLERGDIEFEVNKRNKWIYRGMQ